MSDPHNPQRYGELWSQLRIDLAQEELCALKKHVTISGGWAWHFMSPIGHKELKHAHDHKDIDIFVQPENVPIVYTLLRERGFTKVWTKYDRLNHLTHIAPINHPPSPTSFSRYEKVVAVDDMSYRLTIDLFITKESVPLRTVNGWTVVSPEHLLTLYKTIHSSSSCFAVTATTKLLAQHIDPVGRTELVEIPKSGKA